MKDVERILLAEDLENQLSEFYQLMKKKEKELNKLQAECKHEIVVITEYSRNYGRYDDNVFQKCLYCGKESNFRTSFNKSQYINAARTSSLNFLRREVNFEIVKRLFIKVAKEHPEFNTIEIKELVEKQIKKPTHDVWEIINAVCALHNK